MMHKLLGVLAFTLAASNLAWSHGDAPHKAKTENKTISTEEKTFGREGDPKKVARTVKIDMADTMRYSPSAITVKKGETVRFEAKNSGKVMHEIVLGTMQELKEHAELMRKHPGMEHLGAVHGACASGKNRARRLAVHQAGRVLLRLPHSRALRSRNGR